MQQKKGSDFYQLLQKKSCLKNRLDKFDKTRKTQ